MDVSGDVMDVNENTDLGSSEYATASQAKKDAAAVSYTHLDVDKRQARKGHDVVYIKEGAHIVDSLNIMEAYVSLMQRCV